MPIRISRTVRWIDKRADSEAPRIRPPGLDSIFANLHPDFGRFICVSDNIRKDDHFGLMMHQTLGPDIWFQHHDGSLVKYRRYGTSQAKEFLSSFFLQTNVIPRFIKDTARSLRIWGDAYMPVFYFPNCTILMGVETCDLDAALTGRHPKHRDTFPSELLGVACALTPTSMQHALELIPKILAELATHTQIVSIETGLNLELGDVAVPQSDV